MRKFNAIITAFLLLLFVLHGVLGAFQMIGVGGTAHKIIAWIALGLVLVHTVIGVKYTVDTLRVRKAKGVGYFRENKLFWARRISGFAIMVLLIFHLTAFSVTVEGATRLVWFNGMKLTTQILLVAAIALHVVTNVKPLLISFGVKSLKERAFDILLILSVLLLFMAAGLIIYYLRWNVW